jgi:VPS5-like protein
MASATGEFAQTVSDLAGSDLGKSVSHSLEALAELERKAQETESAQARADQVTLLATADEYARLVNSVRVSVMSRLHPSATDVDLSVHHRWRLVRVCECTTHGRMPMQTSAASSRCTSAIVHKARPRLTKATVSGIHILKLARCIFYTLY